MQAHDFLTSAQQCPYAGGPAVYQARALLDMLDTLILYDDVAVCQEAGIYRLGKTESSLRNRQNVQVYPNPATDEVFIRVEGVKEEKINLAIFDAQGRLCLSEQNSKPATGAVWSQRINVIGLKDGYYIIQVNTDTYKQQFKLTLIR
jgi:hypothetical protein